MGKWSRTAPVLVGGIAGVLAVVVVALLVMAPLALMHQQTAALEGFYGDTMLNVVSGALAGPAPRAGDQEAGRGLYLTGCAQCHGANGDGNGAFGFNAHPAATDLTGARTKAKSKAQLLWIVRNGVSFSGMPAFAKQYNDDELAGLVAYVRQLQANAS